MGGPTYIDDPRVQEAVALGQLLLRSREAAQAQNDRLFQRKQETASFDERRRQFNEEQKRLADAQKMQQADAERRAGLAERELQQRAAEFQGRQQGDAEDRLFRRQSQQESIAAGAAEGERERAARMALQQRGALDQRALEDLRQQFESERDRLRAADASMLASDRDKRERDLADLNYDRTLEVERARGERAAADRKSEEERAQARLDAEREKNEASIARDREKTEGSAGQQRKAAITAQAARFRIALEEVTGGAKGGAVSPADQAAAVRSAYRLATQPELDPQKITREALMLGPDGEAERDAELARIADEFFPEQTYFNETPWGEDPIARLGENVLNRVAPDWLREWAAQGRPDTYRTSGGRAEADRLFKRLPGAPRRGQ